MKQHTNTHKHTQTLHRHTHDIGDGIVAADRDHHAPSGTGSRLWTK